MKLAVPLYLQDPGSKDCGLAGIQMILAYYQDSVSLAELKETLDVDQTGTYAPQLGTYLLHRGYTVEIVSLHPKLFTTHDAGMNTPEILTRFRNLKETEKNEQNKKVLDYFIFFEYPTPPKADLPEGQTFRVGMNFQQG